MCRGGTSIVYGCFSIERSTVQVPVATYTFYDLQIVTYICECLLTISLAHSVGNGVMKVACRRRFTIFANVESPILVLRLSYNELMIIIIDESVSIKRNSRVPTDSDQ